MARQTIGAPIALLPQSIATVINYGSNTMSKHKRQPKAGDLALKCSKPFAIKPREFAPNPFAAPMYRAAPDSEKIPTVYPAEIKIRRYTAGPMTNTWKNKGNMMGGATGACKGITSAPDVARAFIGTRG